MGLDLPFRDTGAWQMASGKPNVAFRLLKGPTKETGFKGMAYGMGAIGA
jgi:hypothetical protein